MQLFIPTQPTRATLKVSSETLRLAQWQHGDPIPPYKVKEEGLDDSIEFSIHGIFSFTFTDTKLRNSDPETYKYDLFLESKVVSFAHWRYLRPDGLVEARLNDKPLPVEFDFDHPQFEKRHEHYKDAVQAILRDTAPVDNTTWIYNKEREAPRDENFSEEAEDDVMFCAIVLRDSAPSASSPVPSIRSLESPTSADTEATISCPADTEATISFPSRESSKAALGWPGAFAVLNDCCLKLLNFLSLTDIARLRLTCRAFNDGLSWRNLKQWQSMYGLRPALMAHCHSDWELQWGLYGSLHELRPIEPNRFAIWNRLRAFPPPALLESERLLLASRVRLLWWDDFIGVTTLQTCNFSLEVAWNSSATQPSSLVVLLSPTFLCEREPVPLEAWREALDDPCEGEKAQRLSRLRWPHKVCPVPFTLLMDTLATRAVESRPRTWVLPREHFRDCQLPSISEMPPKWQVTYIDPNRYIPG